MTEALEIRRVFDVPPELVWESLTSASAVAAWFWPFPTTAEIDTSPGGPYRLMSSVMTMDGTVVAAEAPRTLAVGWRWVGEDDRTEVRIAVTPTPGGAEVHVWHGGFAEAATRDDHVRGWSDCLDRLPAWLTARGA